MGTFDSRCCGDGSSLSVAQVNHTPQQEPILPKLLDESKAQGGVGDPRVSLRVSNWSQQAPGFVILSLRIQRRQRKFPKKVRASGRH